MKLTHFEGGSSLIMAKKRHMTFRNAVKTFRIKLNQFFENIKNIAIQ